MTTQRAMPPIGQPISYRQKKAASEAEHIANLSPEKRAEWLGSLSPEEAEHIEHDWKFWRRDDQQTPEAPWETWLVLAGRGYGKTRMGAEWVRAIAEAKAETAIALVGSTAAEARALMVEGRSGLLNIAPAATRPVWEPSLKRLTWKNGSMAYLYSAADPEGLRGPEHHIAWCDEIAKWDQGMAVWDNLALTMRLGSDPQIVATTTPRPVPLLRRLLKHEGVIVTRGRMEANRSGMAKTWLRAMRRTYDGTRFGRQELDGDLLEDFEGALWSRESIERCRVGAAPELRRVVVGVDPPAGSHGDACGIVAVGLGADGNAYVIEDASVSGLSPEGWARAVAECCERVGADRVVAEANNGGKMVESVLRSADSGMPVKLVHASHGKVARAEPVFVLYHASKAFHVGAFPALEDELCGLLTGGEYRGPGRSPDRADALVWAMTELMLGKAGAEPRVRVL